MTTATQSDTESHDDSDMRMGLGRFVLFPISQACKSTVSQQKSKCAAEIEFIWARGGNEVPSARVGFNLWEKQFSIVQSCVSSHSMAVYRSIHNPVKCAYISPHRLGPTRIARSSFGALRLAPTRPSAGLGNNPWIHCFWVEVWHVHTFLEVQTVFPDIQKWHCCQPPNDGEITLWSATNRWYVLKCVSLKRN